MGHHVEAAILSDLATDGSLNNNRSRLAAKHRLPMSRRFRSQTFAFAIPYLLLPALCSIAAAQDATLPKIRVDAAEEPPYVKSEASTGTKTDAAIRDIPQAIVVVSRDLLEDRGVVKLNEALDTVAGIVRESVYGGNTATAGFVARGFRAAQLRDGMRLSIQGFGDAMDIGAVESIEVLKGPASVLYGASEPGGTLNIITKKPHADFAVQTQASANTFGAGRLDLDLNTPLSDTVSFRVNLAHEDGDTYRDFVDRRTSLLAPVLQWSPTDRTTLTLRYEHVRTVGLFDRGLGWVDSYLGTGIDYRDLPPERFLGEPSAKPSRNDTEQSLAKVEHEFANGWRVRVAYSDVQFDWDSQAEINLDSFDPDTGLFNRYFGDYERQGENTRTAFAEVVGEFSLGSTQHQLLVGADDLENRAFYIGLAGAPPPAPIDVFNPVYPGYEVFTTAPSFSGLQGSSGNGFYAQDLITFSPRWKALIAARYDDSQRYSGAFPGQPDDFGEVSKNSFSRVSPRAGLVFQPSGSDSLYASFSTSFAPALFIKLRDPSSFKPELGKQFEVGWKRDWFEGRLTSTLAAFDIRKRNVAQFDPTNEPDEDFEVQIGEFHSRGVELDASGELFPGLRATLGLAYAKVTVSESEDPELPVGARIDNFPKVTASFWLTKDLGEHFSMGGGVFHAGSAPTALPDNGVIVPSYTRFDASVTWRHAAWRVQLSGKNLTDKEYYATSNTIMPQPPRHAWLSAAYSF
jgi:iron complex outermembrane receptor protein